MNTISHGISSFLVLKLFAIFSEKINEYSLWLLILSMFFANLPDLDSLWNKVKLKDHHKGYFHAPLFWIGVFGIIALFGLISGFYSWIFAFLFLSQVLFHLFTDWFTARTAGIAWFYPFSKKEFSLFKVKKDLGNFYALQPKGKAYSDFKKFYWSNWFLVGSEIFIVGISLVLFFVGL